MLMPFNETSEMISSGKLLHIAGTENLIKKLPKGNWIGGSTEYFMAECGGKITNEQLFVTSLPYSKFKISEYDKNTISNVAVDAFNNGFSIVVMPFDSAVHRTYAEKAPEFKDIFMKNIMGWVTGFNLNVDGQTPITVNGQTGEALADKAVMMHVCVPDDKQVSIGIVNIFSQCKDSPIIEFAEEGFSVKTCLVNGKEVVFADYIEQNGVDIKSPLVGDYSGVGVNISFKSIEHGVVSFYAPVFCGIKYRMAKSIENYVSEFNSQIEKLNDVEAIFSCNCILNFLYGELEGKGITKSFSGPITFGEVAYQLLTQTLVYVAVS